MEKTKLHKQQKWKKLPQHAGNNMVTTYKVMSLPSHKIYWVALIAISCSHPDTDLAYTARWIQG